VGPEEAGSAHVIHVMSWAGAVGGLGVGVYGGALGFRLGGRV